MAGQLQQVTRESKDQLLVGREGGREEEVQMREFARQVEGFEELR